MATLGEIELSLYDQLGFELNPDSKITRRVRHNINNAHREILGMYGIGSRLRRQVFPFTTTANSPYAVLPVASVHTFAIVNRTNQQALDECTLEDLRAVDPGLRSITTTPKKYVSLNKAAAVAQDPASATELFVVSDSASDGTGLAVNVEGMTSDGAYRAARVALNGLTRVSLGATITTWATITKFYLSAAAQGHVTLQDSSSVELARISPGMAYARYSRIQLYPTPSAAVQLYADIECHVANMTNSNDEPYLPEDFDWVLEAGCLMREYTKREKLPLFQVEKGRWDNGIKGIRKFINRSSGAITRPGRMALSQLGPWFPRGT